MMCYDTIPSLTAGRQVISTVRFLDFDNPRPCELSWRDCPDVEGHEVGHFQAHPSYVPFRDYGQLVNARKCDLILDEVTGIASSRESQSMPFQVSNRLVQLRRLDIAMRWTAPAWGRADIIMRECSQGVTLMSASMPQAAPLNEDGSPRLWMRRRLFCARTYDPTSMDEFQSHKADDIKAEVTAFYWGPGSSMFRSFSTLDSVASLGWANESGMCMVCAGKRAIPKCSCEKTAPVLASAKALPVALLMPTSAMTAAGPPAGDCAGSSGHAATASVGDVEGACDDTVATVGVLSPGSGLDLREALDVLGSVRC